MNQFSWLTFSKLLNGGLYRFCVMFPQSDVQHQNTFVTQPFIATPHESQICLSQMKMTSEVPTLSLPYKLNQQNRAQYQYNFYIKLLKKIVDAIILCGKQNIPLRGHRDDTTNKGNFLAILQMMSNSGLIYQKQIRTPYIPAKPFRMRLSNSLEITSQVKF